MVNPKDFQVTPFSHKAKIDKSGPNKNLSAHGRPDVKATPQDHWEVIPHSGSGRKSLGQGSTSMGLPHPMSSDRSEMPTNMKGMHPKIDKSEPKPPADVKKWSKKNYDMSVPATDSEGSKIAAKMKAH